jgi:hypothetical protein
MGSTSETASCMEEETSSWNDEPSSESSFVKLTKEDADEVACCREGTIAAEL